MTLFESFTFNLALISSVGTGFIFVQIEGIYSIISEENEWKRCINCDGNGTSKNNNNQQLFRNTRM